jgi:hypothetical protein
LAGVTLDEYFVGFERSRSIFEALRQVVDGIGPNEMRVSKSQVAFRRRTSFAYAWTPARYLRGGDVPLVLTVGLRRRDDSPRWKQVVEPVPGRYTHHLELRSESEIDDEVHAWLLEAWELAR